MFLHEKVFHFRVIQCHTHPSIRVGEQFSVSRTCMLGARDLKKASCLFSHANKVAVNYSFKLAVKELVCEYVQNWGSMSVCANVLYIYIYIKTARDVLVFVSLCKASKPAMPKQL